MAKKHSEKKAIISGSTTGIGYAIAEGLAKTGISVLLNGRTKKRVEEAVARLKKEVLAAKVSGFAADLSNAEGVNQLIEFWPEADILVNNVGIFGPQPFFEITDEDWVQHFQINVMSGVRLSRHYTQGMVQRKWGRVIFSASASSGFMSGEQVHFGATKAAVLALSRGLAESVAGSGVTVNAFLPGPTRTERVEDFFQNLAQESNKTFEQLEKEMFNNMLPYSLVKRFVGPKEAANLVVYLASEEAAATTGAALRVDGGILRTIL